LSRLVRVFDERVVVGALDHHHFGAELFFGGLVELVDEWGQLGQGLLLKLEQIIGQWFWRGRW
jgi:hypothetical protein